jgi:hypothetical protein
MTYFGSYNIRLPIKDNKVAQDTQENPEYFIDNYNYIFRVNTLSSNKLEIIDIMYINTNYEYINIDNIYNIFKEARITPGMIIKYENDTVYFTHPAKGFNNPIEFYEIFKHTKYIQLEGLEKIKQNMIKFNKILSS